MIEDYAKKSIAKILRSPQTVFTFKDIFLIWGSENKNAAMSAVNYYVKTGQLYHIRRGIYSKDKNYDRLELATRIYTPAYISFETVLGAAGITFQYYDCVFVAAYQSKEIVCGRQKYCFRKIKKEILLNSLGVENKGNYSIAVPERALLDTLYLHKKYYFDNLSPIDWEKARKILPIYRGNRRMEKVFKKMEKNNA